MTVNQSETVNEAEASPRNQPVSGDTPGTLIRRAREAAGLSRKELSERMCFIGDKLTLLENDDYARLPASLYIKGYIRNICKELDIDEAPILQAYSGYCGQEEDTPAILDHVQRDSGPVAGGRRGLSGLALVSLIAVGGAFWWMNGNDGTAPSVAAVSEVAETASAPVAEPAHPEFVGDDVDLAAEEQVAPGAVSVNADEAGDSLSAPGGDAVAEAVTEPAVSAELPAEGAADTAPAEPTGTATIRSDVAAAAVESPAVTEPEPASLSEPVGSPVTGNETQASPVDAAVAAAAETAAAQARLQLSFAEDAWIEVKDASGSVLVAKLQPAGSGVDLRGEPPFKLMLGNAAATEVRFEGELVDSSPLGNRRTRRITVGH
ncbi:RodZ domain-containing protein [Microbulbifer yueqingensis]|uniref:Cytoskeleton protein RodZ n=1 Tax=Microbulbifer yueqingensis TaxID=658219 RepID=A0A1G8WZN7_9GAMM|nr:RodZ domain-containing protein [Microbulbifer yueqingensis]SDJ83546.1 cytoskeleton protein RodZ [Microbulbifer yueqingensis]